MASEMFRKQSPVTQSNEDISKRISSVDNIALNKERKNLFNQIETQDAEYYPFGTPGGGIILISFNFLNHIIKFNVLKI